MKFLFSLVILLSPALGLADLSVEDQLDMMRVLARRANARTIAGESNYKVRGVKVSDPKEAMEVFVIKEHKNKNQQDDGEGKNYEN